MAASKPTSSLSKQPHILSTERHLGTLAAGLACLPLAREAYPSRTDSRVTPCGIRSLIEFGHPGMGPEFIQCSTSAGQHTRLALKLFRGEPAITGFD